MGAAIYWGSKCFTPFPTECWNGSVATYHAAAAISKNPTDVRAAIPSLLLGGGSPSQLKTLLSIHSQTLGEKGILQFYSSSPPPQLRLPSLSSKVSDLDSCSTGLWVVNPVLFPSTHTPLSLYLDLSLSCSCHFPTVIFGHESCKIGVEDIWVMNPYIFLFAV